MTLRLKILAIVGLTLISLIVAANIAARTVLVRSFDNLEEEDVRRNTERVLDALNDELATLSTTAGDYAGWDDTYEFVRSVDRRYIKANLTAQTFAKQRLNLILFTDTSHRVVYAQSFGLSNDKESPLPEGMVHHLATHPELTSHQHVNSAKQGIIMLPRGPMLVASRPILTSEYKGPIRGSLVMGRDLDATEIERLCKLTHLAITAAPYERASTYAGKESRTFLARGISILVRPRDEMLIAGQAILTDVYGHPALVLTVTMDREVHAQGRRSLMSLQLTVLLSGLVFTIAILVLMEKAILVRLANLSESVRRLSAHDGLVARVEAGGQDELSRLAGAINGMLDDLSRSQADLEESEERYRHATEDLRAAHQQLLSIIESLPDPVFVIDRDGVVIAWNQAIEMMTGVKRGEMLGKKDFAYAMPFYGRKRPLLINLVAATNAKIKQFYKVFQRSGRTVFTETFAPCLFEGKGAHLRVAASPLFDSEDRIAGAIESMHDITDYKHAEEQLIYLSVHDPLTGLYNRVHFEQQLRVLSDGEGPLGIILCDIDGLKLVNDAMGHDTGDRLLIAAADVVREPFDPDETAARIGGDEFAILLPNCNEKSVARRCQQLKEAIGAYNAANPGLPLSLSIGYASGYIAERNASELFKEADNHVYREKLHHSQSARSAIVQTLLGALEARDFITEGHAVRLHGLSAALAEAIGLPGQNLDDLWLLAQFHDIGKVGIPDRILFKTSALTPKESMEMQRHSEIGYRIAMSAPDLVPVADLILKHHEWWNGGGYPLGLKGEEIPLACRILAIADAYDAMTNDRPYRQALTLEKTVAELRRQAGTCFDPILVQRFLEVLANYTCEEQVAHEAATSRDKEGED